MFLMCSSTYTCMSHMQTCTPHRFILLKSRKREFTLAQSSRAQHIMAEKLRQQQEAEAAGHTVSIARNKRAVTVCAQPTLSFLYSPESKHEDWYYLLSWRISVNLIKIILTEQDRELTSLKHPLEASVKAAFLGIPEPCKLKINTTITYING